jgi:transcriptional regulator with XRE-family HTH domain
MKKQELRGPNDPARERKKGDEQPLVRALLAQATRQGHTLGELAQKLGVTYERLSQWRRNVVGISRANESVCQNAARYLGIPTVLAMVMAQKINIQQFVWPGGTSLTERVAHQLERLRQDPFLGGFVPAELTDAAPSVQLFVVFLYRQLEGQEGIGYEWIHALTRVAAGGVQAGAEGDAQRGDLPRKGRVF